MKSILAAIFGDGLVSIAAVAVLCALAWFGGMYLGWDTRLRVVIIIAILVVWLVLYVIQKVIAVRKGMRIETLLRAQSRDGARAPEARSAVDHLRQQFRASLRALRGTRGGDAAVAAPWFLVLGPPGSGKTAAIRESGLTFPYLGLGHRANPTAGATRGCDWWYAEGGVLLDSAGGYVADPARANEWRALLNLIRRARPDRGLDGVVLVVAMPDLLAQPEDRIDDYAQGLRDRLDECSARLGQVFPVQLVFTKCDLLHGFADFFAAYDMDGRAQPWGCTLEWRAPGAQGVRERFEAEFQRLYHALRTRRVEALSLERDPAQQQNALLFPIQFALLQKRLGLFIDVLVRPNPFQESARLRGFWFTSAAQQGKPVDQVLSTLGRQAGETPIPALAVAEQRPYFLTRLFSEVILSDTGLAGPSLRAMRHHRVARTAVAAASIAASLLLGLRWWRGYVETDTGLREVAQAGARLRAQSGDDRAARLRLDDLRSRLAAFDGASVPYVLRPGLWLGDDAFAAARELYRDRFASGPLPLLTVALKGELAQRIDADGKDLAAYSTLADLQRLHLMLAGTAQWDHALAERLLLIEGRWARATATAADPAATALADAQVGFALARFTPAEWRIPADAGLVERANRELAGAMWVPLVGLDVARAAQGFPAVGLDTLVPGPGAALLRLDQGFSGLYTQAGWDGFVAKAFADRAAALSARLRQIGIELPAATIAERLREQYLDDHHRHWRELLARVEIAPFTGLDDAAARLAAFAGPSSPARALYAGVWRGQALDLGGGTVRNVPVDQLDWLDEALKPLATLHIAVAGWATAQPGDGRFLASAQLDQVTAACHASSAALDPALARILDPALRRTVGAGLHDIVRRTRDEIEKAALRAALTPRPDLVIDLDPAAMDARFASPGRIDPAEEWAALVAHATLPQPTDARAAAAGLARLTGPESAYRALLCAAARAAGAATPPAWIDEALSAVATAHAEYAATLGDGSVPPADDDRLDRLVGALASADAAATAALAKAEPAAVRVAAGRELSAALTGARRALERDLYAVAARSDAVVVVADADRVRAAPAADDHPAWWRTLAQSAHLVDFAPAEATDRLDAIVGAESRVRHLLRGAWRGQVLTAAAREVASAAWLDRGMLAVTAVRGEYAALAAGAPGSRLARVEDLRRFVTTVASAEATIAEAVLAVEDPVLRAGAERMLRGAIAGACRCLGELLAADADHLWTSEVLAAWQPLAASFPFAETELDADPAAVAALFGAKSGSLWRVAALVAEAETLAPLGRPLLVPSAAWTAARERAVVLRDALYAPGEDTVAVRFAATFHQRAGIDDALIQIGAARFSLYDEPSRRRELTWKPAEGLAVRIAIASDGFGWLTRIDDRPWALFRALRAGGPVPREGGGLLLRWPLVGRMGADERAFVAQIMIDNPALDLVAATGLLSVPDLPAAVVAPASRAPAPEATALSDRTSHAP